MATDASGLSRVFFEAACTLSTHTGSLQERLADAYADHLLSVLVDDLPTELQATFRELEQHMNAAGEDEGDDPFLAAALRLSDAEASALINRVVALFGRLASAASR